MKERIRNRIDAHFMNLAYKHLLTGFCQFQILDDYYCRLTTSLSVCHAKMSLHKVAILWIWLWVNPSAAFLRIQVCNHRQWFYYTADLITIFFYYNNVLKEKRECCGYICTTQYNIFVCHSSSYPWVRVGMMGWTSFHSWFPVLNSAQAFELVNKLLAN